MSKNSYINLIVVNVKIENIRKELPKILPFDTSNDMFFYKNIEFNIIDSTYEINYTYDFFYRKQKIEKLDVFYKEYFKKNDLYTTLFITPNSTNDSKNLSLSLGIGYMLAVILSNNFKTKVFIEKEIDNFGNTSLLSIFDKGRCINSLFEVSSNK